MQPMTPDGRTSEDAIVIHRTLYTMADLDERYKKTDPKTCGQMLKESCRCSGKCVLNSILKFIPIIGVLKAYKWKEYIVSDMIAGLSSAFIHLPQGLGYGILASMNAINGLYTGFFSLVPYMIFGTSPHISMGTNAVFALLTSSLLQKQVKVFQESAGLSGNATISIEELTNYKISISALNCLLVGFILCGMGILRLGFLTSYLAKSFIGGFTFAAAVHIATSQVIKLLHLKLPPRAGAGVLIYTWIDIFRKIPTAVPGDIIVGLVCFFILLGVKVGINEKYRHKLKIPIPIELIVVIISTAISHLVGLQENYGIAIVGDVPTGMPAPALPPLDQLGNIASDAFVMAILVFVLTIAIGKLCAKLHSYDKMDDNQELIAYGLCNITCGFFHSFASSSAPPRSMLLGSLGSKTILNGFSAAAFLLLVLLVAGELFVSLPIAMLAGMILVAMKDLLLQISILPVLWRVNKPDFFIWLVTAIVSVLGELDIGLLAGAAFSILTVLFVSQLADGSLLGVSDSEDLIYIADERLGIQRVPGVRIFRFESQLYFASVERFKKQIYSLVFNPTKKARKTKVFVVDNTLPDLDQTMATLNNTIMNGGTSKVNKKKSKKKRKLELKKKVEEEEPIHHLILDCSAMTYIDMAGIDMLLGTIKEYTRAGVEVFLACIPANTIETLHRASFFQTCDKTKVFFDLHDALRRATELPDIAIDLELPEKIGAVDNKGFQDDSDVETKGIPNNVSKGFQAEQDGMQEVVVSQDETGLSLDKDKLSKL